MISTTDYFKNRIYQKQDRELLARIKADSLSGGGELDLSDVATNFGSISRRMDYETGKFSPSAHSFVIANTKRFGQFLFNLRKKVFAKNLPGTQYWMNEGYDVFFGFKENVNTAEVHNLLTLIATLGNGTAPNASFATPATMGWGNPVAQYYTSAHYAEETIHVYQGDIHNKTEARTQESVSVSSNDVLKKLNDFKTCTSIVAGDVFDLGVTPDDKTIQQVIKYGTHKLLTSTVDTEQQMELDKPYTITRGYPNVDNAKPKDDPGGALGAGKAWYFPFLHKVYNNSNSTFYQTAPTPALKVWYWDWVAQQWEWLANTNFTGAPPKIDIIDAYSATVPGIYAVVNNIAVDGFPGADDWDDYRLGTGAYFDSATAEVNPQVAIETSSYIVHKDTTIYTAGIRPPLIIWELLTGSNFLGLADALLDLWNLNLGFLDTAYSFDEAYSNLANEFNTDYSSEITVMKIIEDLCLVSGCMLTCNQKKVSTSEGSNQDRRIHLIRNKTYVHATDNPPADLTYSTNAEVSKFDINSNSGRLTRLVEIAYNQGGTDLKGRFSLITKDSGNPDGKILSISLDETPPAYWYAGSGVIPDAVAQAYLDKLSNPWEDVQMALDCRGLIVELGDYVKVYDHKAEETIVLQIYNWSLNLMSGAVRLTGKKVYSSLD